MYRLHHALPINFASGGRGKPNTSVVRREKIQSCIKLTQEANRYRDEPRDVQATNLKTNAE
jgi:hypothetical protein